MIKENKMLKLLQPIKFPALQILNLKCNLLESIEGLSRMELNLMKSIFLCTSEFIPVENCIYSTSEIAKIQWPSLDKFSFCTFYLQQMTTNTRTFSTWRRANFPM